MSVFSTLTSPTLSNRAGNLLHLFAPLPNVATMDKCPFVLLLERLSESHWWPDLTWGVKVVTPKFDNDQGFDGDWLCPSESLLPGENNVEVGSCSVQGPGDLCGIWWSLGHGQLKNGPGWATFTQSPFFTF